MTRAKIGLYTLGLMIISIMTQCHPSEKKDFRGLTIDVATDGTDSIWYSYTYGSSRVTIDTIKATDGRLRHTRSFGTDTIDLINIFDEDGRLLLPIIPERQGCKVFRKKATDTLLIEGMKEADIVYGWHKLIGDDPSSPSDDLIAFLRKHERSRTGFLILKDLRRLTYGSGCFDSIDSLYIDAAMVQSELMKITGTNPLSVRLSYLSGQAFPYTLPIRDKDERPLSYRSLVGKQPFFAVQFFHLYGADSITMAHRSHYLKQLDSLKIPSCTLLPDMQELPKGWKPQPIKKNNIAYYFVIDTAGEASKFAQTLRIKALPSVYLVDSTNKLLRTWIEPDSLISFVKQYQEQIKEAEKASKRNR